ncbi:hypothetical protein [Sulfuracidifex metallicus]|uniref:hypothetical protein n=1 Tax=Sulfuracidifex metallicus TaxID=47303 RepID=UPI002273F219|nr:hypothetical protein [Sulfuracidifex metallicus]MCY0850419.1 hypothetical protein [Sulfuracidifex metallicus]
MNSAEKTFIENTPRMKIDLVDEEVPCSTECLRRTNLGEVLADESFREQLEILDSIISLIQDNVISLKNKVEDQLLHLGVDVDNTIYAIYRLVKEGGDLIFGSDYLKYNERIIFQGDFNSLNTVYKKISSMREDQDVKALCDQIRNLTEATWRLVNKNLRRMFEGGS